MVDPSFRKANNIMDTEAQAIPIAATTPGWIRIETLD